MAKSRKKAPPPADETKSDKFRRLANQRLPKAVKAIYAIGNLAGASYQWTPEQITTLVATLHGAVDKVEKAFTTGGHDVGVPEL